MKTLNVLQIKNVNHKYNHKRKQNIIVKFSKQIFHISFINSFVVLDFCDIIFSIVTL